MAPRTQRFTTRQHMQRSTFEIFRYRDFNLKEVALHHHDFYEIYFFLSGSVRYIVDSSSYQLSAGDILLISPLELHQPILGPDQRGYERIVLWINRDFLQSMCNADADLTACFDTGAPGHTNLLHPPSHLREMLIFQLEQLGQEMDSQDYCGEYCAMAYLVQILILLNRQARRQSREAEAKAASDSVVYQVLNYINTHYSEDLTLDFLANQFFISKYHLSREFGRLVGTSVHRYITQRRLIVAKRMLQDGIPSTQVYQHCGFGDYSNFYRAFKAEYQLSPREFMATLKPPDPHTQELSRWLQEGTG